MTRSLRSLQPANRALLFAVLAAALLAQLLVPQGWMPAADGSARLTMCSGMGPMEISAEAKAVMAKVMPRHGKLPASESRGMDHPCAFAGLGLWLSDATLAVLDPPGFAGFLIPATSLEPGAPGRGLAAPPPPATGPPLSR